MKYLKIILFLYIFSQLSAFAQGRISIDEAKTQIKNLLNLKFYAPQNYSNLKTEALNKQINTNPKGEFESSQEYSARISKQTQITRELNEKFKKDERDEVNSYIEQINNILDMEFVEPVSITFLEYNADTEEFTVEIKSDYLSSGKVFGSIKIDRDSAKVFKENVKDLKYSLGIHQILYNGDTYLTAAGFELNNKVYEIKVGFNFVKLQEYNFRDQLNTFKPAFLDKKNLLAIYTYYNYPSIYLIDLKTYDWKEINKPSEFLGCDKIIPSSNGDILIATGDYGVFIFNIESNKSFKLRKGVGNNLVCLSPNGEILAVCDNWTISLYDTKTFREKQNIKLVTNSYIEAICFSYDSNDIIYFGNNTLTMLNIITSKIDKQISLQDKIHTIKSISRSAIVLSGDKKTISIDVNSGLLKNSFYTDSRNESDFDVSSDGQNIFIGGTLFDFNTGKILEKIGPWYFNCKFSENGKYIAINNQLWQVTKRKVDGLQIQDEINDYTTTKLNLLRVLSKEMIKDNLMTTDYINNKGLENSINIKEINLNSDFEPEYLVEGMLDKSNIRTKSIYGKIGSSYKLLLNLGPVNYINIVPPPLGGYQSIEAITLVGEKQKTVKALYKYNGTKYVYKK